MMRYLLPVILVATPLISYIAWYHLARQKMARDAEGTLPRWQDAPWTWIVLGTAGLMILALVVLGLVGADPQGVYVPARYEDGAVVPGYVDD